MATDRKSHLLHRFCFFGIYIHSLTMWPNLVFGISRLCCWVYSIVCRLYLLSDRAAKESLVFYFFKKKEKHFQIIEHTQNILNTSIALTNCAWFIYRNFYLIQQEEKEFCSVLSSLFFFPICPLCLLVVARKKSKTRNEMVFLELGLYVYFYSSNVNDDQVKPRSLRFTWSMKTTSSRDPNEIMMEIRKVFTKPPFILK